MILVHIRLVCDHCPPKKARVYPSLWPVSGIRFSPASLRLDARADGWQRKAGKDICPDCAKAEAKPEKGRR
jgi:hypothetical protein